MPPSATIIGYISDGTEFTSLSSQNRPPLSRVEMGVIFYALEKHSFCKTNKRGHFGE
jgi:hypothetical protein